MDQELVQRLQTTQLYSPADKQYLLQSLGYLDGADRARLLEALRYGDPTYAMQMLQYLKAKLYQIYQQRSAQSSQQMQTQSPQSAQNPNNTTPNQQASTPTSQSQAAANPQTDPVNSEGILSKVSNFIKGKREPVPISMSILTQPQILGTQPIQPATGERVEPLAKLQDFYHPLQLSQLGPEHFSFGIDASADQLMQSYLQLLADLFDAIENITLKRAYFMNFLQSRLFTSYINTAVTALKHPEIEPRSIALNLMNQQDQQYLNTKQFEITATLSNHLRNLVGL